MALKPVDARELEAWESYRAVLLELADVKAAVIFGYVEKMGMSPIERLAFYSLEESSELYGFKVACQHPIGPYRADFLVTFESYAHAFRHGEKIVIECDGHDFHERTKEQAQHDKKRDRYMQALGFRVYRFTGSEVYKSLGKCVVDSLELHRVK